MDLLSLEQAKHYVPGDRKPGYLTMWRWARKGLMPKGGGRRIRLRHVRMGCNLFTKEKWMLEFAERLAEADAQHFEDENEVSGPAPLRSTSKRKLNPRRRLSRQTKANQTLREAGILPRRGRLRLPKHRG